MKIEKRDSGSYRCRKMVNGKTISITFDHKPTKHEVEEAFRDAVGDPDSRKRSRTFGACAQEFIEISSNVLKPSTLKAYSSMLGSLPESFTRLQIMQIDNGNIQALINDLAETHSPKTTSNFKAFISSVLRTYRPDFRIYVNTPARKRYQKYVPTSEEVNAVLEEVRGTRLEVAFRTLMYGLRRGEVAALTGDDVTITPTGCFLTVNKAYSQAADNSWHLMDTPKTDASNRTIPIDEELARMIKDQGYAWKGEITCMYKNLVRIQNRLGQPHWRLHDYRAYMVSELDSAGIGESTILAMGGWSSPNVMKSVYRKSRLSQNATLQDEVKKILS